MKMFIIKNKMIVIYIFSFLLFIFCAANVFTQKETFVLTSYTPEPGGGWKKEVKENFYTRYTITNN